MRGISLAILLAAAISVPSIGSAKEMQFELQVVDYRPQFDLHEWIFADGEIETGTVERFLEFVEQKGLTESATIFFNSPGGSALEGMELGDAIRELRFRTNVGTSTKGAASRIGPGICASACVFGYMGGEYRYLQRESQIGIHQFYFGDTAISGDEATAVSQLLAGQIVAFLARSRVDADFFRLMTETMPEDLFFIPQNELERLRVVTGDVYSESWSFEMEGGAVYLRAEQRTWRGENKLLFICDPSDGLVLIAMSELPHPASIIAGASDVAVFVDGDPMVIPKVDIVEVPHISNRFVSWAVSISPGMNQRLRSALRVGSGLLPPSHEIFSGFDALRVDPEAQIKLTKYLDGCR